MGRYHNKMKPDAEKLPTVGRFPGRCIAAALWLACVLISAPAAAEEKIKGWYVGVGGGAVKFDGDCDAVERVTGQSGCAHSDYEGAGRVFLGYQFNRYIGVEAGYADLGSHSTTWSGVSSPPNDFTPRLPAGVAYQAEETVEIDGTVLSLVLRWPFNDRWHAIGKVGWFEWDQENVAVVTTSTRTFTHSIRDSGPDTSAGLAIEYRAPKHFALRVGWDYYAADGDHHDLYAIDFIWRF